MNKIIPLAIVVIVAVISSVFLLQYLNMNKDPSSVAFVSTEKIQVTNVSFSGNEISVTAKNTGTSPVTISVFKINNSEQTYTPQTIQPDETITINAEYPWKSGNMYNVQLFSSKGNQFRRVATAP
jgi:hypothetical protein